MVVIALAALAAAVWLLSGYQYSLSAQTFAERDAAQHLLTGMLNQETGVRATIERLTLRDTRVRLTASFGVAELPTDAVDVEGFVRVADHALHEAKHAGRNRVAVAPPPDVAELAERRTGGSDYSEEVGSVA